MEYLIKYNLHKDSSPIIESFDSEEKRDIGIKEKEKEGYKPVKIQNSNESILFHLRCK